MALADTLAQIAALQDEPQPVPPQGSPQRPRIAINPPAPAPAKAPPAKPPSILDRVGGAIAKVTDPVGKAISDPDNYAAVGAALVRAPGQLVGGITDTAADVDKWLTDNVDSKFTRGPPAIPSMAARARNMMGGASFADTMSFRQSLGQVGNVDVNQGATQAGAIGLGLLTPAGELKAGGAITAKVTQLLASSVKVGALTGVTADTTGDANPLATRAKEAGLGFAANVVAEPLLGVIGSYIKARPLTKITTATPEEAVADKLDRGFASARTSEARYQAQEAAAKGEPSTDETAEPGGPLESGTRHTDANGGDSGGVPNGPDGSKGRAGSRVNSPGDAGGGGDEPPHPLYQDANSALEAAGAAERVAPETHPLRPDGKIPVADATKDQLDEAGLGRAFAAASEDAPKDPVIFKEEDADGGSRTVGIIDKESLQGFKDDVDAIRYAGEQPLDTDAAHASGQWKLSNLGASYDVPPFLRGLADQLPEREALTDEEVMTQAKAMANEIGWDPADMIAYAAHVAGDAKQMPAAMATIRTVYARAASMVDALLEEGPSDWTTLSDDHPDLRSALEAIHNIVTLSQSVAEFKSAAGQTLRVAGLPDADAFLESFGKDAALKPVDPLDGLPKLPRNKDELQQWLDAWNYTKDNPAARDAFLKGLTFMPGKWLALRTSFANFYTAGIISGVSTFARDLLGPATIGLLRTLERTTGGYAAALNPFLDEATKQDLLRSASQAPLAYIQTLGAVKDALQASAKAFVSGNQVLQTSTIYDLRAKTIPSGLIEAAMAKDGTGVTGPIPYMLANVVNVFPQFIHAIHGGVNEFAQRLSYLGEVRASAMLEAAQQGLQGPDAASYVKSRLLNSTDEVTWAGKDAKALESSQRTTLIKPVGGESQPIVSRFNDFIRSLRTNLPESRYVLPIFTVPANAIGEGIRRIPVVGQLFAETRQELAGEAGAAAQAEAYGRVLSGASLMLGGFALARAGLITGPGPADPHARAIWEAQGFQPYAIKIGDTWVGYNRLDVVGNMLAIPAAVYDHSIHRQTDNQSATFAGIAALAQYFKDQSAMQGVADLMSFGGSPQESQSFLTRLANQTAGSMVVPNFITQLGRNNLDPDKRVVRDPFEAILDKLPGASKLLDPQRNPLGEETNKIQNAAFNTLPISLTHANSYAEDPVVDELDRLYQVTGYAPGLKSPALPGGKEDMRDIKLEDGHSLYDALMRYRGTVTNDGGMHLREAMKSLMDSPEYATAVDGDGNNLRTANGDLDRGAMVSRLLHTFDVTAQHEVAKASPIAARYLAVGAAKQANDAFLRNSPTESLVKNPALMTSLGIDIRDYEDRVRGQ